MQRVLDLLLVIWLLAMLVPCLVLARALRPRSVEVIDRLVLWYWRRRHAHKYTNL